MQISLNNYLSLISIYGSQRPRANDRRGFPKNRQIPRNSRLDKVNQISDTNLLPMAVGHFVVGSLNTYSH